MRRESSSKLVALQILLEGITDSNLNKPKSEGLSIKNKVLFIIENNPNCSPATIIHQLNIAKSNLAIMCKGLIDIGLIDAKRCEEDKRNIVYNITEKGQKEVNELLEDLDHKIVDLFSPREIKALDKKTQEISLLMAKGHNNGSQRNNA